MLVLTKRKGVNLVVTDTAAPPRTERAGENTVVAVRNPHVDVGLEIGHFHHDRDVMYHMNGAGNNHTQIGRDPVDTPAEAAGIMIITTASEDVVGRVEARSITSASAHKTIMRDPHSLTQT